jgi:hypothetical protein
MGGEISMVATVSIYFSFGGVDGTPGTEQDVDALGPPRLRFKLADNATIDTLNKLVIPSAAGTNYSLWKQIYLYCDDPDTHTLDNLKFYSDGTNSFGTGVDLQVGLQFPLKDHSSSGGYEIPTLTGDSGDEMVAGHTIITSKASVFGYSSVAPLAGPSISEAGNVINAVGETSNYLVLQMDVTDAASPGELPVDETLTIQYDES